MNTPPADPRRAQHPDEPPPEAWHLDEDAEALEDPVHSGEARHQHDRDVHQADVQAPDGLEELED